MEQVKKITIITGLELIEAERKRLLADKTADTKWWNTPFCSNWARSQFGETLTEKDGATYANGTPFDEHMCQICGKIPPLKEKVLQLEFSFCEEYDCSMNICKKCLGELKTRL